MRGPQDTTQAAWSNGKPSVFLVVFKIPGANVIKTVEAIKGTLTSLQASIPPTIHISVLSDAPRPFGLPSVTSSSRSRSPLCSWWR